MGREENVFIFQDTEKKCKSVDRLSAAIKHSTGVQKERQNNMWKDHKQLNRISESIAGWHIGKYTNTPYYIKYNPAVDFANSIEYSLVAPTQQEYPEDLFQTTAGRIEMFDDGEFGGYLAIGGKKVCDGNFSIIFEYAGDKYVIDSLRHMCSGTFRLIRVNDNGTIAVYFLYHRKFL